MSPDIIITKKELEKRLQKIENQIREIKERLPAHSIKPVMMNELITLEDERDEILTQMQSAANQNPKK